MERGYAPVECCNKRRGLFPGGVLVCSTCDFDHTKATTMPNENKARDVPEELWWWKVGNENA